ncbi:MAG: dihydrodipicolinate synthase family protein [Acidobacteria bacterium]|nr:dihydrodipicolinate synthase family protein [Acidobacteriota bacterium]
MTIAELIERQKPGRKVKGIAASLLPFQQDGRIAVDAFQKNLVATHQSGLMNAVNMDTGYVNYLSQAEKQQILGWTREALGNGVPFVAGAFVENSSGDIVGLYIREMEGIVEYGGTPILFQTARLRGQSPQHIAGVYEQASRDFPEVLAFELGPMFAASGEIFDKETVRRLMDIPHITGMKHSSLNRMLELERLSLRDRHRPDFRIYTGNDLGINMIEFGSDYLLGLAAFAPEKFAARDRFWENGNPEYYGLADALQYLGNLAFRDPVPAYKHSAAIFLHAIGRIPSNQTHPQNPRRPEWESAALRDCAYRLGLLG